MKTYRSLVSKHFQSKTTLGAVLLSMTKMDEPTLIDSAQKGAVWLQKGKGKILRERSLTTQVSPQDTVSLYYDKHVLSLPTLEKADCLFENNLYGVWFKEAGIVPQGSQAGDHSSLLRYIERMKNKEVFLVHRLDRETAGIMIYAYDSKAAGKLSDLFQRNLIEKEYQAVVLGQMEKGSRDTINVSLDDKEAITHYEVMDSNPLMSLLRIKIETGRLHQIRRHLDHIGHPVMGDPKYGLRNKNKDGLKLLAKSLSFKDPWENLTRSWVSPKDLTL